MKYASNRVIAGSVLLGLVCVGLAITQTVLAQSSGRYPEARLQQSCFDLVWAPDEKELMNNSKWRGYGYEVQKRLVFDPDGPGDGRPSIVSKAWKDTQARMAQLRLTLDEALKRKPVVARMMMTVYIPENAGFTRGDAKFMLGLWGKEHGTWLTKDNCFTLCPPPEDPRYPLSYETPGVDRRQIGFTVRASRQSVEGEPLSVHGPKIYSYHLNRENAVVNNGIVYGESSPMEVPFPTGKWFKLIMDVRLDSWDWKKNVSRENGYVDMYMYDMKDNLIGEVHRENLIFRDNPTWHIHGPFLLDLWGKSHMYETHQPTETSKIYYRDLKMFFMKKGVYDGQCKNWKGSAANR